MATKYKESDTDDRDRPGPSKKQKTSISVENSKPVLISEPTSKHPDREFEDTKLFDEEGDKKARAKLHSWQVCQVAKGVVDNTINSILENYKISTAEINMIHPFYAKFPMEDRAVAMAIQEHGLIRSLDFKSSLNNEGSNIVPENSKSEDESVENTSMPNLLSLPESAANTSIIVDKFEESYSCEYEKDFLDRAVAEAIKKKGLSMLSVDYG